LVGAFELRNYFHETASLRKTNRFSYLVSLLQDWNHILQARDYRVFELCPLSGVLNNTTFRIFLKELSSVIALDAYK
jgi:hypothetical protein